MNTYENNHSSKEKKYLQIIMFIRVCILRISINQNEMREKQITLSISKHIIKTILMANGNVFKKIGWLLSVSVLDREKTYNKLNLNKHMSTKKNNHVPKCNQSPL